MSRTPISANPHLAAMAETCQERQEDLKAQAERLWWAYELLSTLLLTKSRDPCILEIPPIIRDAVADLETYSPMWFVLPDTRLMAEEFYWLVDPACGVDKNEEVLTHSYVPTLLRLILACQTLYFVYGQLRMAAKDGVSYLEHPKQAVLRLQFQLE